MVSWAAPGDLSAAGQECDPSPLLSMVRSNLEYWFHCFSSQYTRAGDFPAGHGEDYGEAGNPPAAHGCPQWSRYPPATHRGRHTRAGGCPKEAVASWEACNEAGSWQDLQTRGE